MPKPGYGAAGFCLLAVSTFLQATEITIPLTVRYALLTQELARQVYTDPGGTAHVWRESDCRSLTLDRPNLARRVSCYVLPRTESLA
jgi:hypothetical protein